MSTIVMRRRLRARRAPRGNAARPLLIGLLGLVGLGAVCAAAGLGAVFAVYNSYADDYVPIEEKLLQVSNVATEVYDRGGPDGGVLLGTLSNPNAQLLDPVPLEEISPWLVEATISTEDDGFWDHPGVNLRGLVRAAYENYIKDEFGSGTGGSSITQQLIKNVYICPSISAGDEEAPCLVAERSVDRKLREIAYAIELEQDYSKEEILTWYLNQISYADRYIGAEAAAQGYFRKPAKDLTLAEAALLAGIPQAPTQYHPRLNCVTGDDGQCIMDELGRATVGGDAKLRQEDVLELMVRHNRATREEVDAAKAEELKVYLASNPQRAEAFIDNQVEPRLIRMCEAGLLPKVEGAPDCKASVHAAGYRVTTTLDWEATATALEMAREFINTGLANGCECNNAAIVTIEPSTGEVIVYAPNRDPSYRSDRRVAGEIDQLVEINQPGSSFKPAVYLTWFDGQDKSPMSIFWDTSPLTVEGTAITNPRNDGKKTENGLISARAALGGSQNVGAFRAAQEAGVDNVIETARKLGITTLAQGFDPTFRAHSDVTYGASIATGGANIRAIDMAYMDATIANMGKMVGTPHLADYVEIKNLKSTAIDTGANYDLAVEQKLDFIRGNIRIPGTRELDPIVVLQVRDKDGGVLYTQPKPTEIQVMDAGSVWLLHSIMSDCTARFIIWGCGGANSDLGLDFYSDGVKIPSGVKTGTQQGPLSASDTLETWMTGYSRHAATAVWVGNATNELVNDRQFASANTTVRLWKTWMGTYHSLLTQKGVGDVGKGFDELRPANVAQREFETPATDRTMEQPFKYCDQKVTAWVRTDVTYESQCEEKEIDTRNGYLATDETPAQFREKKKFVKLPEFKKDLAEELAKELSIPIAPTEKSTGQVAVAIANLTNGRTITSTTQVVGSVQPPKLKNWKLEIGESSKPDAWKTIGSGTTPVNNGVLGTIEVKDLKEGVYTVRLTTDDGKGLSTSVVINVRKGPQTPVSGTPGAGGSVTPTPFTGAPPAPPTPTPFPTQVPTPVPTPKP